MEGDKKINAIWDPRQNMDQKKDNTEKNPNKILFFS